MIEEAWKPISGYDGIYEVSDLGRVRSLDRIVRGRRFRGIVLAQSKMKSGGYCCVGLSDGPNGVRTGKIHQLVCAAFIGPVPPGQMPLHGDGNPENNALSNLRYGTGAENVADAKAHGTFKVGSARSQSKLNEFSAAAIRALRGKWTRETLAMLFEVSTGAVQQVHQGKTWGHAPKMTKSEALEWFYEFGPAAYEMERASGDRTPQ